jgi:hypothetical protein
MSDGSPVTPSGATPSPRPRHHRSAGRSLDVTLRSIRILDTATGAVVGTIR